MDKIWFYCTLLLIGYSLGILTGVKIDVDKMVNLSVKKLKQKRSPGGVIDVDVDAELDEKSPAENRKIRRQKRREKRKRAGVV